MALLSRLNYTAKRDKQHDNENNQSPDPRSKNTVEEHAAILELLASRICHDLISPVGAVNNGVEFIQETGDASPDAIELIAMSAHEAAVRLQMFRLAYGAGGRDPNIKPEDIHKVFLGLTEGEGKEAHKVTLDWDPHAPLGFDEFPTGYCKTLAGVLMLSQECLPKGGTIQVQPGEKSNQTWVVAQGENCAPRTLVKEALARELELDDLDPRLIHPYALSVLAANYGLSISIHETSENRTVLMLSA
jgi:histidine phosphotransferase ChpT